jgi:uncharacterized protein
MRVEGPRGPFGENTSKDKVGGKKSAQPSVPGSTSQPASFVEELQGAIVEEDREETSLERLLEEVEAEGKGLVSHPDDKSLKSYREAVKKFLLALVRKAYKVKLVEGRGPNPKLFVSIEKIEGKLEDLARTVLAQQKQPLRILSQVEELRGLLLDLKT